MDEDLVRRDPQSQGKAGRAMQRGFEQEGMQGVQGESEDTRRCELATLV